MKLNSLAFGTLAQKLLKQGSLLKNAIEPRMPLLFEALELVNPEDVKVVILGQDPTPQEGKATGVAFHVNDPLSVPAVLHLFLEVAFEGFPVDLHNGDVTRWAKQGVLLLNTAFTCPHSKYRTHLDIWKDFTISLIEHIGHNKAKPSVWLLWGNKAKDFSVYIDKKHLIIEGGHPSPTGTAIHGDSFFGGNYFNGANQFLRSYGRDPIDWSLSNNGLNSLNLTPENWEEQLEEEKEEIERKLNVGKKLFRVTKKIAKKGKAQLILKNRLKRIDEQLRQLPYNAYEQLKDHYQKMVDRIREIQSWL